ncbi:uncharacterized protein LOC131147801 [Malania oleifera]|uniref:uncharacterized protein LOC131147801 n=1 Tax=Malania oleifera TaxID=397392 RepID=UPI0025AEB5B0|nr:uncharacterized protein LOC131147801 [Malania oleifera]
MKEEEVASTWVDVIRSPVLSPPMAPNYNPHAVMDEFVSSQDRNYALHGKVVMLVLIITFFAFLLLFAFVPHLRRITGRKSASCMDSVPQENCCLPMLRKRENDPPEQSKDVEFSRILYL